MLRTSTVARIDVEDRGVFLRDPKSLIILNSVVLYPKKVPSRKGVEQPPRKEAQVGPSNRAEAWARQRLELEMGFGEADVN